MSQRFVIDINVNGAQGSGQGSGQEGAGLDGGAVLAGAGAAGMMSPTGSISKLATLGEKQVARIEKKHSGGHTSGGYFDYNTIKRNKKGLFKAQYTGDFMDPESEAIFTPNMPFSAFKGSMTQELWESNQKQIKTAAIAAAWKVANTTVELHNYTSGDSYANTVRSNQMKLASYAAAFAFNPLIGFAMVGNEAVNAFVEGKKYDYDRKLERGEITNIIQIAGDISYGKARGGK